MERPKGAFTPDEPGALPLDQVLEQITKDDQEEWEYEYSATETETFYLTVELSYPEFKDPSAKAPRHNRGGYYKNWTERGETHDAPPELQQPKRPPSNNSDNGNDSDEDNVNEEAPTEQDDQDDGTPLDPALLAMSYGKEKITTPPPSDKKKGKQPERPQEAEGQDQTQDGAQEGAEEPPDTEDIQILDLHSSHPLFSYRGRLFEGHWAEVVGTEVILDNSSSGSLPSLRNLPGGISLLAASSSRIMTTEKIPRPKIPEDDTLGPIKEEWNIRIPIGKDKTGERAEQIGFLENLMALKLKRGDKDHVTVYAVDGKGKDWDDRRPVDYRPRRRKTGEEFGREKRGKQEVARRPKGRPSLATRLEGYPVGFGEGASRDVPLSTMTPTSWEDLDRDDEEESGGSEEDDEDEDEDATMTG